MNTHLLQQYSAVRDHSVSLAAGLSAEDCCVQSMPDASPAKWHLGHTTWFFETFVLERFAPGHRPHAEAFRVLFNSYYNAVGDKHPRPQRGLLTRPSLEEVLSYRHAVDRRMRALLASTPAPAELGGLVELGLQHEQQHQELLLTDIKHLFSCNPLLPAYAPTPLARSSAQPLRWLECGGGVQDIGHTGAGFCFDNEQPRHTVFLRPCALASRLVSNQEYLEFVNDGGYQQPGHWLAEGWDWCRTHGRAHPLYWRRHGQDWQEFTLHGAVALDPHAPVLHVSYFEADAYARWAKARLPSEAEWECAAVTNGPDAPPLALHPQGASNAHDGQWFGAAWQWTQSSYAPYPGFQASPGAVGEYNGKFMVNQYVLRGSSCITPHGHARTSYRNFFPTAACWQYSGIRLARDI